jgi:hypothetical protein
MVAHRNWEILRKSLGIVGEGHRFNMTMAEDAGPERGRSDTSASVDSGGDPRWQQIEARIAALVAARPRLTITKDSAVWLSIGPKVLKRQLYVDANAGWESYYLKLEPGAEVPPHSHASVEECLVLSGEIEVDGDIAREGDLHIAFTGHDHGTLTSRDGALLYIRGPLAPLDEDTPGDPFDL